MNNVINNEYIFEENMYSSEFNSYQNSGYIVNDSSYLFTVGSSRRIDILNGGKNKSTNSVFLLIKDNFEKEKFYITAIKNLLKQKNYINLIYELNNSIINEDEFNNELIENESNYLIRTDEQLDSLSKIKNLLNVISKIDENLGEEDLVEIFSISDSFVFKNIALRVSAGQISDEVSSQ